MKMKRIKLFEAFNSIDKIKKVNFILLCWVIKNFIKDNELKSELPEHISHRYETKWGPSQFASIICFNLMSSTGRWFAYNPAREDLDIYCFKFINKYLVDNKIVCSYANIPTQIMIYVSAQYVIKKMYVNEKNKTI